MKNKKTIVLGASSNPSRYSFLATESLNNKGHDVIPIGLRKGKIGAIEILTGEPDVKDVHTITLYMRASIQKPLYPFIFSLHPQRIIFNPGAENPELVSLANEKGIETLNACTLVMLSTGQY
ncbi:MAG TPA: CoA-binding protein [Bacteroidia bacterium]|nr:CoA-binding protein [Bacteroidia bacterium]